MLLASFFSATGLLGLWPLAGWLTPLGCCFLDAMISSAPALENMVPSSFPPTICKTKRPHQACNLYLHLIHRSCSIVDAGRTHHVFVFLQGRNLPCYAKAVDPFIRRTHLMPCEALPCLSVRFVLRSAIARQGRAAGLFGKFDVVAHIAPLILSRQDAC